MPYNLCMSPAQIARCNRALLGEQIAETTIARTWAGRTTLERVVQLDADGIRRVIDALRARPEPGDELAAERWDDATLEDLNVSHLADTLELVLDEAEEDPNFLQGVCL